MMKMFDGRRRKGEKRPTTRYDVDETADDEHGSAARVAPKSHGFDMRSAYSSATNRPESNLHLKPAPPNTLVIENCV
jgi:hypothetical protein